MTDEESAGRVQTKREEFKIEDDIPLQGLDYSQVFGRCAENVVGFVPIPLGIAGPLLVNGRYHNVPMATTEGCLIASTSRGCKAITRSGGVTARVLRQHMTRAPVLEFKSLSEAVECRAWLLDTSTWSVLADAVRGTSKHTSLEKIDANVVGSMLYVRIACNCSDAMGMNMTSKAAEVICKCVTTAFPSAKCLSLSSNLCCDKKSAAINWTDGRGCHVVCEARIPASVVSDVLKSTPEDMANVHVYKNLVGSALAGTVGGNNAHAANVVAAIFAATGQDLAQVGTSSMCLTHLRCDDGDLVVSCTMPCVEVGVVGGGTHLTAQRGCVRMSGCESSTELACVLVGAVLAAEISLIAALQRHHLVSAHMTMNRKPASHETECDATCDFTARTWVS